ncbi:MAG: phospholipase [Cyclobacteriaceae bacterium]|nr:phospholipase [Cyclobacteriaceae bacterium]
MFERFRTSAKDAPYIAGTSVKLIRGGIEYFDLLEKMISSAKHIIHFQMYIFDNDATGQRIATALKDASRRGVRIFLMLDAYASKNLSKAFIQDLKDSGIRFHWFAPILKGKKFYLGRRLHHKVIVIDSFNCLVGGLNISDKYNDTEKGAAWLDWALYSEGTIGTSLAGICIRRFKTSRLSAIETVKPTHLPVSGIVKNCEVRPRRNDWIGRRREISRSYVEMFNNAADRIIIMSPYFLPGQMFRNSIKRAAKRGVSIKVILAGVSDIGTSKYAERYLYRWLFMNKVRIFEYNKTVLHGKIAVCDSKWMTIGSYNLNNLSAYASVELNIDVKNPTMALNTENCLTEIMDNHCEEITEEKYHRTTGWLARVMQKLAYNLLRLAAFIVIKKRE